VPKQSEVKKSQPTRDRNQAAIFVIVCERIVLLTFAIKVAKNIFVIAADYHKALPNL
jgi:hypothetical protein